MLGGVLPLPLPEPIGKRFVLGFGATARAQIDDGAKADAALKQFVAQIGRVGQVAIMADRERPERTFDHKRLGILDL